MKPVEIAKVTRSTWVVREAQGNGLKINAYNNPVGALAKYLQLVIGKKLGR